MWDLPSPWAQRFYKHARGDVGALAKIRDFLLFFPKFGDLYKSMASETYLRETPRILAACKYWSMSVRGGDAISTAAALARKSV